MKAKNGAKQCHADPIFRNCRKDPRPACAEGVLQENKTPWHPAQPEGVKTVVNTETINRIQDQDMTYAKSII